MKNLWTVTRRELNEWRPVLWVSAALLLLALALPSMPGMARYDPADVRASGSILLGLLLALGMATALGSSLLSREISEGRLGFYLANPLTAAQIWFGKVLAGVLVLVGSVLVVQLPALFGGNAWIELVSDRGPALVDNRWAYAGMLLLGFLLLLLLTHALGLGLRSRSPWLALDALGLATNIFLMSAAVADYLNIASERLLTSLSIWLAAVTTGWLVAGWLQLRQGGADIRRGHRWLATVGWTITVLASLSFVGRSQWIQGGDVEVLDQLQFVSASPSGPWIAIAGENKRTGHHSGLLFNTETRTSALVSPSIVEEDWVVFAPSGGTAYTKTFEQARGDVIEAWSLTDSASQLATPPLQYPLFPQLVASDGRIGIGSEDRLELFLANPWRLLGSTRLPVSVQNTGTWLAMLPNGNLRIFSTDTQLRNTVRVWDFDGAKLTPRAGWQGRPIQGWEWLEDDGAALRFVSGETLYRLAVDDEVPVQPLLEQGDPRWFRYLAHLENARLTAMREQDSTRIAVYPPPQEIRDRTVTQPTPREQVPITVPGLVISFKERRNGRSALLSTLRTQEGGGTTLFYRVGLDSADNPTATEIASAPGTLVAVGNDLFSSAEEIVKLDFDSGILETVLRIR